jgi:sodium/hydrogen antiporter
MEPLDLVVLIVGALVLGLGLVSEWLERSPAPASLLSLIAGVALGPAVLGVFDPAMLGDRATVLERMTRLALGVGLVAVALRIPREFPRRHWRTLLVLTGLGMPLMWVVSTGLVYLILPVPLWMAAVIGAIVTPTDPIAASPIVTGPTARENLPGRVRHAISFDSGANDGLGYLFVFLPALLLTRPTDEAWRHWLVHTLLWEVIVATAAGLVLGYTAARLLRWAEARGSIESDWRLVYTVAMALTALGIGRWMGADELLVVFAAGIAFVQVVSGEDRRVEEHGEEAVNRFFAVGTFALLGTALPWDGWAELGWSGAALAAAVLVLRRPVPLLLLRPLLPDLRSLPDALYVGWFGPIAVAAVYYAALMEELLGAPVVWHAASLVIAASVVAHGVSATALTRLYGTHTGERAAIRARREAQEKEDDDPECESPEEE